jgi:hypothetical protein
MGVVGGGNVLPGIFVDINNGIAVIGHARHNYPAVDDGFGGAARGESNCKYQRAQDDECDPHQQV